jgi:hypothetical protein
MMERHQAVQRLVVLVPIAFVPAVLVALAPVIDSRAGGPVAIAVGLAASAALAWYLLCGIGQVPRVALSLLSAGLTAALGWLLIFVVWPFTTSIDATHAPWALPTFVFGPLVLLALASIGIVRTAGSRPPHLGRYWGAAAGAVVVSYPLMGVATSVGRADDMSALLLLFIPALALCIWAGPAGVAALKLLPKGFVASAGPNGETS